MNDGAVAGQTVAHQHTHLIPRYSRGSPNSCGGVRWVLPDKAPYRKQVSENPEGQVCSCT
ncbi:MAG: HIT domain-containing protein [Sulfuritalea sp.]|nr:HIT domain-containing protein [Sulfuritalea sp.]MBK8120067.1 HIT domain-containing protein [Sulfuritalea sp.]